MQSGIPLSDEDRWPWLKTLAAKINEQKSAGGAVLACSALKDAYRQVLRGNNRDVHFIYLQDLKTWSFPA